MKFEKFSHWLTTHLGERKLTATLGGRKTFYAKIGADGKSLIIEFGSKDKSGKLSYDNLKMVWDIIAHFSVGAMERKS